MSKAQRRNAKRHGAKRAAAAEGRLTAVPESEAAESDIGAALSDVWRFEDAWAYEASTATEPSDARETTSHATPTSSVSHATPANPVTPTGAWVTDLQMYNKLLGVADTARIDQAQGQAGPHLKSPAAQGRAIHLPQAAAGIAANRDAMAGGVVVSDAFVGPGVDSISAPAAVPGSCLPEAVLESSKGGSACACVAAVVEQAVVSLLGTVGEVVQEWDSDSEGELDLSELMALLVA